VLEGEVVRVEMKQQSLDSGKPRTAIAIIGDVDHGKSSLVGHLLYDCGEIHEKVWRAIEKQAEKLGKDSFKFAWIMDRLREERQKGVTITWKLWTLSNNQHEVDIIDCPGHSSFVKNMAVGSSLADAVVCVVSAKKGEFEFGFSSAARNTQREIIICKSQGIQNFIFAINKMDVAGPNPEERFHEIRNEILHVIGKKYGIKERNTCFVPISAWTGMNLVERDETLEWWKGTEVYSQMDKENSAGRAFTLFECMDLIGPTPRDEKAPLVMPLTNVYKIPGVGTVLAGRILSGRLNIGDAVCVAPVSGNVHAKVKSMEIFHSARAVAIPGDIVGVSCAIPPGQLKRGMVLCKKGEELKGTLCFVAQLKILPQCKSKIRPGYRPYAFLVTNSFSIKFDALLSKLDKKGQVLEENPMEAVGGDSVMVRLVTETYQCVDVYPSPLGRFIVRDANETVALGLIKSIEAVAKVAPAVPKAKGKYFK
jgi:elongation factor 1-alpha